MLRHLLLVLAVLALAACTAKPIQNPREVFPTDRPFAAADVREAILEALRQRGWETRNEGPGLITASIDAGDRHQAWIDIPYSTQGYQIRYRESAGLDYDGEHIHRNYNKWVQLLDAAIRRQLQLPAPEQVAK